jgi:hypothetical protein
MRSSGSLGRRPLVYAGAAALTALSLLICVSMIRTEKRQASLLEVRSKVLMDAVPCMQPIHLTQGFVACNLSGQPVRRPVLIVSDDDALPSTPLDADDGPPGRLPVAG